MIITIISVAACAIVIVLILNGLYWEMIWSYEFQKKVGGYFDTADRASDAKTKSIWFNKFVHAIEDNHLNEGTSAVWQNDKPQGNLGTQYEIAKSLNSRLQNIASMNPSSQEYQFAMNQITLQEFCWFPIDSFGQAFLLRNGVWHMSLFPADVHNRCSEK